MKTQIIHLDPEDDHHSAREKLRWAKAPRVVLVWPGRGRTLFRQLDLVLMQRESQQLGIQLGLISYDPQVIEIASDLGIPIFDSIEVIDQQSWARPAHASNGIEDSYDRKESPNPKSQVPTKREIRKFPVWFRSLLFGSTAIILLGVIAASLPSARITLDPLVTVRTDSLQITIATDSAEVGGDVLPAQSTLVEVSATLRVPTSGAASAPNAKAAGEVLMTNVSSEDITLPSGARLRALNGIDLTFETTTANTIPAGEMVVVPILALDAGPVGNLEAGMVWALEGELGLLLDVQNQDPMTGGSLSTRLAVSASDLSAAQSAIRAELLRSAQEEIERLLTPDQILLPGSLQPRTLASAQDYSVGEIADSLEVTMTLEVEGLVIEGAILDRALESIFKWELEPGTTYLPASLSIINLTLLDPRQTSSLQLSAYVQASSYNELDRAALAPRLRGIPRDEADQVVQDYEPGFSILEIQTRPTWLPVLPLFEFQIAIALPWEVVP